MGVVCKRYTRVPSGTGDLPWACPALRCVPLPLGEHVHPGQAYFTGEAAGCLHPWGHQALGPTLLAPLLGAGMEPCVLALAVPAC